MASASSRRAIERAFDAGRPPEALDHMAAGDPELMAYLDMLRRVRSVTTTRRTEGPQIADAQMPAFTAGIRAGIRHHEEAPAPRRARWTMASLTAAALWVAVTAFWVFTAGPDPVDATPVESTWTELEGVRIDAWYDDEQGVTTVWMSESPEDIW